MSKKVLDLLKTAEDVLKKIDQLLDKVSKLSTNANMHLEFGTEGTKAIYLAAFDGIQFEQCRNPNCSDFGAPPETNMLKTGWLSTRTMVPYQS